MNTENNKLIAEFLGWTLDNQELNSYRKKTGTKFIYKRFDFENDWKAEFLIYKENVTNGEKVKIMSNNNITFDRIKKIEKYLYLGYKVYELNGKEIKL
jgi:hypothetical protein